MENITDERIEAAREIYVTSLKTYSEVAQEVGLPLRAVKTAGAQGGWREERSRRFAVGAPDGKLTPLIEACDSLSRRLNQEVSNAESIKEIKELVSCLKDLTAVTRNLNGLPTFAEAEQMKNAREKLMLDGEKDKPEDIKIIIEGDYLGD